MAITDPTTHERPRWSPPTNGHDLVAVAERVPDDGRHDPTIRYLVGSNVSDLTEDLEGIVRTGTPNGSELDYTWFHPTYAEEFLPPPADPTPSPPGRTSPASSTGAAPGARWTGRPH